MQMSPKMTAHLQHSDFMAMYVRDLGNVIKTSDPDAQRRHRREQGKLLDERARQVAKRLAMQTSAPFAPYDAAYEEEHPVKYIDFKLVNEPRKSEYKGWSLNMHFSDSEYQFAREHGLIFMVYRCVPGTSIAEQIAIVDFAEAKEAGFVQLETSGDDVWWSIDLLMVEPNLRWKLDLHE